MLVLPIPMVTALVLGFLFARILLERDRSPAFAILLACCATQAVVVSLSQYYGVGWARPVQPIGAAIIPPLAWVTFVVTAVRAGWNREFLAHLAAPAFTAFCVLFAPAALDVVVPVIFLVYGVAILASLRGGADALPLMRLETGERPAFVWRAIAAALLLSALSDGLIALAQLFGKQALQPTIISAFSALSLLLVGLLVLSKSVQGDRAERPQGEPAAGEAAVDQAEDARVIGALRALLESQELYLDSSLTLARLARRLQIPAKSLSAAINRSTGENVSRYINEFRIERACRHLLAGHSVTESMLASGFNTKSNFNREFLRVTGKTPTVWLAGRDRPQDAAPLR